MVARPAARGVPLPCCHLQCCQLSAQSAASRGAWPSAQRWGFVWPRRARPDGARREASLPKYRRTVTRPFFPPTICSERETVCGALTPCFFIENNGTLPLSRSKPSSVERYLLACMYVRTSWVGRYIPGCPELAPVRRVNIYSTIVLRSCPSSCLPPPRSYNKTACNRHGVSVSTSPSSGEPG